jgi:RimJ/RimL family protein N-acetyltransferase
VNEAPILRSKRLELRVPQSGDLPDLVKLVAADETRRFLARAQPSEAGQFERLLRNVGGWTLYGYGNFAVRWQGQETLIASCGVFHSWRGFGRGMDNVPEAGWIVRHDQWGQGIASEAMSAILAWFDAAHGPRRIAAMIAEGNAPSHKLAHALGFLAYGKQVFEGAPQILYERLPVTSHSQGLPEWASPSAR